MQMCVSLISISPTLHTPRRGGCRTFEPLSAAENPACTALTPLYPHLFELSELLACAKNTLLA